MTVYRDGNNEWKPIFAERTPLLPAWRMNGIAVVTSGKLDDRLGVPLAEGATRSNKARLSFFNFRDADALTRN
jgi:hypothetical protein